MGHDKHDAFFKRLFSDVRIAASAISAALPPEVAAMLDCSSLTLEPTESVDAGHHAFRSDLVYSVRFNGRDAAVVVLVEHESSRAPLLAVQVLQYLVQLWDAELRRSPAPTRLRPIIPIVLSHARRGQRARRDLIEHVDLTDEERKVLGRYVPRVFLEVDELASASDDALLRRGMTPDATLVLMALRDVASTMSVTKLIERWGHVLRATAEGTAGVAVLRLVSLYLLEVHEKLAVEVLASAPLGRRSPFRRRGVHDHRTRASRARPSRGPRGRPRRRPS